ncbi:MAG: TusE/DsrC/DsvC family sulfur relay protein [Bacteroidales bacterium]|jgi:tRNA 2-thiouridine synthesizing protein E|nr:TusE/DsrC/DsvC family sulfur relay protein [Bacteroidales bacterium]
MNIKQYVGKSVQVTEEGYLINSEDWTKEMAVEIAKTVNIELTPKHFEVLEYLRNAVKAGESLTLRRVGKSGIVDIKGLYDLFPGGPLKNASLIAGISKPTSCV